MDDVQHRLAREMAEAVSDAVAHSTDVDRCRERARAAGFLLRVTLEATVGFSPLPGHEPAAAEPDQAADPQELPDFAVSANDRRFLRSLRIAADAVNVDDAG